MICGHSRAIRREAKLPGIRRLGPRPGVVRADEPPPHPLSRRNIGKSDRAEGFRSAPEQMHKSPRLPRLLTPQSCGSISSGCDAFGYSCTLLGGTSSHFPKFLPPLQFATKFFGLLANPTLLGLLKSSPKPGPRTVDCVRAA